MTPGRLLVVEASRKNGSALAQTLSREGHLAKHVANGAAALREVCSEVPPDLLLMDLALPDMDPMKAVQRVKSIRNPEFLPVIALSTAGDPAARVRALRGGADDVIARPCEAEELTARVSALLRIRAAQARLQQENQELERRSFTDPLTGLFNRRYFEYQMAQELERSRRRGDPVSLILMDLDFFKRVNDRYGHGVGDEVLKAFGTVLHQVLRRLDVCARWGGEEFAAILPNTGASGVKVVCQRLLRALRAHEGVLAAPLDSGPREIVRFTASLGVAVHTDSRDTTTTDELFRKADVALYRAKSQGRDRACYADGVVKLKAVAVEPSAAANCRM